MSTFTRKRYTNLVPLSLALSAPTYGNSASIRPMLFSKSEKYYTTPAALVSALVYEPVADSRSRINSGTSGLNK